MTNEQCADFIKRNDKISNSDGKLKSIYFYERVLSNTTSDIDRLQADKRRIECEIKKRLEERDEAVLMLSALKEAIHSVKNSLYRELLERYYLQCQTWEQIAEVTHYSATQIYKLRKQALCEIDLDFFSDTEQYVYHKPNRQKE